MNNDSNSILLNKYLLIVIFVFVLSIIGATYAYFFVLDSNNNTITGDAANVDLSLDVVKVLPNVSSTDVVVPQLSGNVLNNAVKNGCVDSNNNVVCHVYKIDITNISDVTVVVDGGISYYGNANLTSGLENFIPNMKWMLISSFDINNISNTVLGNDSIKNATSVSSKFATNVSMAPLDHIVYYVVVWLNETGNQQSGEAQSFYGVVSFDSSNGSGITATFSGY